MVMAAVVMVVAAAMVVMVMMAVTVVASGVGWQALIIESVICQGIKFILADAATVREGVLNFG